MASRNTTDNQKKFHKLLKKIRASISSLLNRATPDLKLSIHGLSFILPAAILFLSYAVFGMYPFGKKSLLQMDMSDQYVEFLAGLKHFFSNNSGLQYSWAKSLGGNYFGVFAYYISSPFNIITLLFSDKMLPFAIMLMNVVKIGCSGLAFSFFLRYKFKRDDYSILLFSILYALSAYNITYSICIMWLDGVIWLPIILVGLERILRENKYALFFISFTINLISNFYIAYMVGIFCTIYFLYSYFASDEAKSSREFLKKSISTLLTAILSFLSSSWLILPTINALQQGKLIGSSYDDGKPITFTFIDLISKFFIGSFDSLTNSARPHIFTGVFTGILVIGYFFIKGIPFKEKALSFGVLAVLIGSLYLKITTLFWHGFQMPNWFPHRFAFVFCFFILLIAYRAFLQLKDIPIKTFFLWVLSGLAALFIINKENFYFIKLSNILWTFAFMAIYLAVIIIYRKSTKTTSSKLMIFFTLVISVEMYINTGFLLEGLNREFPYKDYDSYHSFRESLKPMVEAAKEREPSFFRMTKTFERSKNDAIGMNFNDLTHYSSSFDLNLNNFLRNMGYSQAWLFSTGYGSTILTDSLLGVKYMMTDRNPNHYYSFIMKSSQHSLYQNPFALSPAFMIHSSDSSDPSLDNNYFENQNRLLQSMSGLEGTYFNRVENVEKDTYNILVRNQDSRTIFEKKDKNNNARVTFKFSAMNNYPLYLSLPTDDSMGTCNLYINDEYIEEHFRSESTCIVYLGTYEKNTEVKITLEPRYEKFSIFASNFYWLDMEQLQKALRLLKENQLNVTSYNNTTLKGTIHVGKNDILFTSIPYDKSWNVYVDGKEMEPQIYMNTFLSVSGLSPGLHHIEMKFKSKEYLYGILASISSLFIILLAWFLRNKVGLRRLRNSFPKAGCASVSPESVPPDSPQPQVSNPGK